MRSWIEIHKAAFDNNVCAIRNLVGDRIKIGAVLKANAYGHGMRELAQLAEVNPHILWLCVASLEEALLLRSYGCKKEILTLAYCEHDLIEEALHHNIVMSVIDKGIAALIANKAEFLRLQARVHVKIDMGLNRLGIKINEISSITAHVPALTIEGIFSHIGITNNPDEQVIADVVTSFHRLCDTVDSSRLWIRHIGASGLVWSSHVQDMVRIGTMLYGSWKSELHRRRVLQKSSNFIVPVLTWKTTIIQVKSIVEGDYVGYDYSFRATKPMRIAILPIGYADGYPRSLSQKGVVFVEGDYAPVIGLISMNLTIIDISNITQAHVGSIVTLVGGESEITPNALATLTSTNPNDITAGINASIPRSIQTEMDSK